LAGNRTDYSGQFVNIDTTPPNFTPSVSGTMGANGWYVSTVALDATATDILSGISSLVVSDNGGAAKPVPVTLTSGTHALTIIAKDVAGNSRSTTLNLIIDTDGPIITPSITGTEGNNNWYVSDVDVTATVSDPMSGMDGTLEVSVDGGAWTTDLPIHFTEGEHTVDLRAYDEAGNESINTLTINVDTTPPALSTSISGTLGNSGWYVSDATTTITATDSTSDIDYIEYKQNSADWKNGTSVLSNDGINTITARVYDLAAMLGEGAARSPRWMLLSSGSARVALAFDELEGYLRVSRSDVVAAASEKGAAANAPAPEVVRSGSKPLPVVSVASLVRRLELRLGLDLKDR
jgi:hypothetical protein